jgi:hypothetical protein
MSGALVLWEVLLTRVYSVMLFYHFAFMAVSVSMFGLTLGALLVFMRPPAPERMTRRLAHLALETGAAIVFAISVQLLLPLRFEDQSIPGWYLIATYFLSALPFIPGGQFVCVCLTKYRQTGKLYAADLCGAGVSCALFSLLIGAFNGPGVSFLVAACCCLAAALLLCRTSPRAAGGSIGIALALVLIGQLNVSQQWLRVRYRHDGPFPSPLYERWNGFSRITVVPMPDSAAFSWGIDPQFQKGFRAKQLWLEIDSGAGTPITQFDGNIERLEYLRYDIAELGHQLRPAGAACIIGPGGGRDVLSALALHQKSVLAIEVNPAIVEVVTRVLEDFSGHLADRPDLRFVVDDGRSYLARTAQRFDLIQASFVDSAAATAAGAYAFTENGLYTIEAWQLFLQRLKPNGILTFSRFYGNFDYNSQPCPVEMYRMVVLGAAALRAAGVKDVSQHMLVARNRLSAPTTRKCGTLLLSREPFTDADVARTQEVCQRLNCELALRPGATADPSLSQLLDEETLREFSHRFPWDISATSDDRPYFFYHSRLSDLFAENQDGLFGVSIYMPATRAVLTLSVLAVLLAALLLLLPVIWARIVPSTPFSPAGPISHLFYFAAIGVAFMFVEVGMIQRLGLFLGHPTYGFTVVLFGLLISSGLGALATDKLLAGLRLGRQWLLLMLVAAAILIADQGGSYVQQAFAGATTPVRIALALLLLSPPAWMMGFAFPMGMELARRRQDQRTAWLWAANGATSVIGSVLAILCSIECGIQVTIVSGAAIYVAAALVHRASSAAMHPQAR